MNHKFLILILCSIGLFSPQVSGGQDRLGNEVMVITLEEAIHLTLRNNRILAGTSYARENAVLSLDSVRSGFDIRWAPSATANLSGEEESDKNLRTGLTISKRFDFGAEASLFPGINFSESDYAGDVGLSLTVPLLRGLGKAKTLDPVYSAEKSLRDAERNYILTQIGVVLDTVSAVYGIIQQKELTALFASQVKALEDQARLAMVKERIGMASPMDIYRAEIRTKDAQESLSRAVEGLQSAKDRLKLILAMPLERDLEVAADRETRPISMSEDLAVSTALDNRIEIAQMKDSLQEAERRVEITKHNTQPELNMVLKYGLFSESEVYNRTIQFDESIWSLSLSSSTDWRRAAEKAAYQQSINALKVINLQYESKLDDIRREVRQYLEALKKAEERIRIREEQISQAEGKLALSQIKFRYNMADNFDVIEASTEVQQAKVDHLLAKIEHIVGIYRLRSVLGTLVDRRKEESNGIKTSH